MIGGPSHAVQYQGMGARRSTQSNTPPKKMFRIATAFASGKYRATSVEMNITKQPCAKYMAESERVRYSKIGCLGISCNPIASWSHSIQCSGKKIGKNAKQTETPISRRIQVAYCKYRLFSIDLAVLFTLPISVSLPKSLPDSPPGPHNIHAIHSSKSQDKTGVPSESDISIIVTRLSLISHTEQRSLPWRLPH